MSTNYKFDPMGSMGSVYTDTNAAIRPPEGMVITAIQFLADNILTTLIAEQKPTPGSSGSKYISTNVAHAVGDATQAAGNGNTVTSTITLTGANANIRPGQKITGHANFPYYKDFVSGVAPIYVKAVSGTTVTLSRPAALPNGTSMTFQDPLGQGVGGIATTNAVFPKGLTIYGRWLVVTPTADANGGIICYFGV